MDTMDVTLVPTPPTTSPTPSEVASPTPRRRWPLVLGAAAVAGLVGLGVGYLAGGPQRSSLADERDAAEAQLVVVQTDLDETMADLATVRDEVTGLTDEVTGLTDDKAALTDELGLVVANRDQCELAATTGSDLISQWENIYDDLWNWLYTDVGTAAEAEIMTHMDEQWQKMDEQHTAFHDAVDACTNG